MSNRTRRVLAPLSGNSHVSHHLCPRNSVVEAPSSPSPRTPPNDDLRPQRGMSSRSPSPPDRTALQFPLLPVDYPPVGDLPMPFWNPTPQFQPEPAMVQAV